MYKKANLFFSLVLSLIVLFVTVDKVAATASDKAIIEKAFKMHIPFVANEGQVDGKVKYYAKTFGGTVFVNESGEIIYWGIRLTQVDTLSDIIIGKVCPLGYPVL